MTEQKVLVALGGDGLPVVDGRELGVLTQPPRHRRADAGAPPCVALLERDQDQA